MTKMIGDASWQKREAARKRKEGFWQTVLLLGIICILGCFVFNVSANLHARNIHSGFGFLFERAGFEIGESLITFSSSESFFRAFSVGFLNTVKVSLVSIFTASLLGVIVGLMRLSAHPLIKFLGAAHVEFYRNIPLLVQLLLVYMLITELLPGSSDALHFGSWALLSKAGLEFSVPVNNLFACCAATAVSIAVYFIAKHLSRAKYTDLFASVLGFACAAASWIFCWIAAGVLTGWSKPEVSGFMIEGGANLSPEFLSLWIGLTLFTSAAIAEIIRAGILAVPKNQWNAAKALGMTQAETVSYIIFPQGLRLAIPPLASQYMNLTKNSSLAVIVGYPDLVSIGNSTINLNGQALEVIVIVMAVYLFLNLVTSVLMNWVNNHVTRGSR
jgi:general L-amino acid transport system permease protein